MKIPNHSKITSKLRKKGTIMANQCTCSNCNCRSINAISNLNKKYKALLAN